MIHKTSYAGAHRWEIRDQEDGAHSNFDWDCCCGEHGHIASATINFALEAFARHAAEKVEEAGLEALRIFASKVSGDQFARGADIALEKGQTDLANLLLRISNDRFEIEEVEAE